VAEKYKKILVIDNEIIAQLLSGILTEKQIPYMIRSYHDSAYDGLFQAQLGYGHVEAPLEYEEEIKEIYTDLLLKTNDTENNQDEF
jgi:hypothetical protein